MMKKILSSLKIPVSRFIVTSRSSSLGVSLKALKTKIGSRGRIEKYADGMVVVSVPVLFAWLVKRRLKSSYIVASL